LPKAIRLCFKNIDTYQTISFVENWGSAASYLGQFRGQNVRDVLDALYRPCVPPQIRERVLQQIAKAQKQEKLKPKEPKFVAGSIYLAQSNGHGLTKIGFSAKPKFREETLQGQDPHFHLIFVSPCIFPTAEEQNIHKKFIGKRKRGEWFELTDQDIERIKGYLQRKEEQYELNSAH